MTIFARLFELVELQPGDDVIVVSDARAEERVAETAFNELLEAGADASWVRVRPRDRNGDELPRTITSALRSSDLVLLLTSWSPSHSAGVVEAMAAGARVMSMPGLRMGLLGRGAMTAEFRAVKELTDRWGEHLARGQTVRVETERGTSLTAELGGWRRLPLLDGGPLPRGLGCLGNFPAGEAAIAPIEGTASGTVVVDLTVSTTPAPLQEEIVLTVEGGVVTDIQGGQDAATVQGFLDEAGESARVVAEIALGTNPEALHSGIILEDEKKLGTAHVGLGNATGFGGENFSPVHIDGVFGAATVSVDGVPLIVEGEVSERGLERENLASFPGSGGTFTLGRAGCEVADGLLYALWSDVRGIPVRSQVGDGETAALAASVNPQELRDVEAGTQAARVAELLAAYGVLARAEPDAIGLFPPRWSERGI